MNAEKTGSFIAELRKQKNMTQKELAKKIGVTDKAISRWETGRGYPDIEFLSDLSNALSVSVNELLNGEIQPQGQPIVVPYPSLKYVCDTAKNNRHKQNKKTIITISVFVALLVIVFGFFIVSKVRSDLEIFAGTENCVIQSDYSYIMYYDRKYVPLDTGYIGKMQPSKKGAYDCELGEVAIAEAKIEGVSPVSRLILGEDKIYYVRGIPNDDIIYLYTDYDALKTQYYVREEKLDYYSEILNNATPQNYFANIEQKDNNYKMISISNNIVEAINNAENHEKDLSVKTLGEESIVIVAFEKYHIFYQQQGELLYENGKYYWYPYQGLPNYSDSPYLIDETYYNEIEKLFSYMHK